MRNSDQAVHAGKVKHVQFDLWLSYVIWSMAASLRTTLLYIILKTALVAKLNGITVIMCWLLCYANSNGLPG